MKISIKQIVLMLAILTLGFLSRYAFIYFDEKMDTHLRSWAYSDDPNKPLLVGQWAGEFTDPDRVSHKIEMEIFEPTTADERWRKYDFPHSGRGDITDKLFFDGIAFIETHGKQDTVEIWGGLEKDDGYDLHVQLRQVDGLHPPGFNLSAATGVWQDHTIDLSTEFTWYQTDGSRYSDSADPRFEMKGKLVLKRTTK